MSRRRGRRGGCAKGLASTATSRALRKHAGRMLAHPGTAFGGVGVCVSPARLDAASAGERGAGDRASPPALRLQQTCGRDARAPGKSAPSARPPGGSTTPPKAGPGTAGILPARQRPAQVPGSGGGLPRFPASAAPAANVRARRPRTRAPPSAGLESRAGVSMLRALGSRGRAAALPRRRRACRERAGGDARGPGKRPNPGAPASTPVSRRPRAREAPRVAPKAGLACASRACISTLWEPGSGGRRPRFRADIAPCGNVRAGCPRSRAPPSAGLRFPPPEIAPKARTSWVRGRLARMFAAGAALAGKRGRPPPAPRRLQHR